MKLIFSLTLSFTLLITLAAEAEKISFRSAGIHLNVPNNFEKSSNSILPETLVSLRTKGPPVQTTCHIQFAKEPGLSGMQINEISLLIEKMNGENIREMFASSSPMFRTARVVNASHTYWSGFRALRVDFNVDLKYLGIEDRTGKGFYILLFTATRNGIYMVNCGHTKKRNAKAALEQLIPNILIDSW